MGGGSMISDFRLPFKVINCRQKYQQRYSQLVTEMGNAATVAAAQEPDSSMDAGTSQSQNTRDLSYSTILEPIKRTPNSKVITVIVDDVIQFEVDVTDPSGDLTCGWLLSEVTRKYTIMLTAIQRAEQKSSQVGRAKSPIKHEVRLPRQKRRYIVALRTKDFREGIDSWLNQYERDLSVLRDGTILIAHFAKLSGHVPSSGLASRKDITIEDFEQMRVVGRGGFSRVILARKKDTGRLYAIKILRKDQIVNENQIKPILSERRVLEQLDHPFVIKLHWAFQSSKELFFVMDICTGGELFFHLLQQRRFSEKLAKFYMSEILLGFQYMHERDIVYRDIKPENILVDMDGHVRIADFGLSKIIPPRERSYSFCGSPEYLSPEMLQNGEGHDRRLDIYCLGVLLYEMLTGLPPFFDEDHQAMFEKIMTADLALDKQPFLSKEVKNLLHHLLQRDPARRYQTVEEIMQHAWFRDVDWNQVLSKTMKPPLVPDINSCYFENEQGEEGEEIESPRTSMYRPTMQGNLSKCVLRRVSYYIHSTVQLQSCVDERASFFRSPSQLRQFFDSSVIVTNMNESVLLQNLRTSFLEGSNRLEKSSIMHKQGSLRDINLMYTSNQRLTENLLDNSANDMPKVKLYEQGEADGGPFACGQDLFVDFDFAQPPLAEIQILRVLENHIKRKKKDQLDKARRFKEQLLMKKQARDLAKANYQALGESATTGRPSLPEKDSLKVASQFSHKAQSNQRYGASPQRDQTFDHSVPYQKHYEQKDEKQYDVAQSSDLIFNRAKQHFNQLKPNKVTDSGHAGLTTLVKEISEPPMQILSDSEVYIGESVAHNQQQKLVLPKVPNSLNKMQSEQTAIVAEEFQQMDRQIGDRIDHYDDRNVLLESLKDNTPPQRPRKAGKNSKAHSLDSFRTEPECLSDPPSVDGGNYSPKQSPFFTKEFKNHPGEPQGQHIAMRDVFKRLGADQESSGRRSDVSVDGERKSRTERKAVIVGDSTSTSQKPLASSDTVSMKKLRYQNKKMKSGEFNCHHINNFDSIQEKTSKRAFRNVGQGLQKVNHKTLQEQKLLSNKIEVCQERHEDSPLLSISQRQSYQLSNVISFGNKFTDPKQISSHASGSLKFEHTYATNEPKNSENSAKFLKEINQEAQPKDTAMVFPIGLMPPQYRNDPVQQNSQEVSLKVSAQKLAESDAEISNQYQVRNEINRASINTESDMTVVNFAAMNSRRSLISSNNDKGLEQPTFIKDQSKGSQLSEVRELPKKRRATELSKKKTLTASKPGHSNLFSPTPRAEPPLSSHKPSAQSSSKKLSIRGTPGTVSQSKSSLQLRTATQVITPGNKKSANSNKSKDPQIILSFASSPRTSQKHLIKKQAKANNKTEYKPSQEYNLAFAQTLGKRKDLAHRSRSSSLSNFTQDDSADLVADETESRPSLKAVVSLRIEHNSQVLLKGEVRKSETGMPSKPIKRVKQQQVTDRLAGNTVSLKQLLGAQPKLKKSSVSPDPIKRSFPYLQKPRRSPSAAKVNKRVIQPLVTGAQKGKSPSPLVHQKYLCRSPSPLKVTPVTFRVDQNQRNFSPRLPAKHKLHSQTVSAAVSPAVVDPRQKKNSAPLKQAGHCSHTLKAQQSQSSIAHKTDLHPPSNKKQVSHSKISMQTTKVQKHPSSRAVNQSALKSKIDRKKSAATISIDLCAKAKAQAHASEAVRTTSQDKNSQSASKLNSFIGSFRKKAQGNTGTALSQSYMQTQIYKQKSSRSLNNKHGKHRATHQVSLSIQAQQAHQTSTIVPVDQRDSSRNLLARGAGTNKQVVMMRSQEQASPPKILSGVHRGERRPSALNSTQVRCDTDKLSQGLKAGDGFNTKTSQLKLQLAQMQQPKTIENHPYSRDNAQQLAMAASQTESRAKLSSQLVGPTSNSSSLQIDDSCQNSSSCVTSKQSPRNSQDAMLQSTYSQIGQRLPSKGSPKSQAFFESYSYRRQQ